MVMEEDVQVEMAGVEEVEAEVEVTVGTSP